MTQAEPQEATQKPSTELLDLQYQIARLEIAMRGFSHSAAPGQTVIMQAVELLDTLKQHGRGNSQERAE